MLHLQLDSQDAIAMQIKFVVTYNLHFALRTSGELGFVPGAAPREEQTGPTEGAYSPNKDLVVGNTQALGQHNIHKTINPLHWRGGLARRFSQ